MKKQTNQLLAFLGLDALRQAVREAIEDHARTGDKVAILRNGKVIEVSAKSLLPRFRKQQRKK